MNLPRVPSPLAGLKREIAVWAGLLVFGAGVAMLTIAANLALTELRYARDASVVSATVLERNFIPADRSDNRITRYRLRYRYTVEGPGRRNGRKRWTWTDWEVLAPGVQFDLAVLPGDDAGVRYLGATDRVGMGVHMAHWRDPDPHAWLAAGAARLRRAPNWCRCIGAAPRPRSRFLQIVGTSTMIQPCADGANAFPFSPTRRESTRR